MDGDTAEWRFAAGGQIEAEGHGIVDLGWRRGPLSAQLFTDTLDLRWTPTFSRGKVTIGVRGSGFASNMWITPWSNGAPDSSRAQTSPAAGLDVRAERWGPRGTWAALEGFARYQWFLPQGALEVADTPWARGAAAVGYWSEVAAARVSAGVDATASVTAPFASLEATIAPKSARVVPFGELRAGWAQGQDDVVATRLGGLTPYHVPFAGAAWAEFWVEDYVVSRVGAELRLDPVRLCAAVDSGVWTYPDATALPAAPDRQGGVGFALGGAFERRGWFAEAIGGASPSLPRVGGGPALSAFFVVGTGWRGADGPAPATQRPCAW